MPVVWSIKVQGGEPFTVGVPGNPSTHHDGRLSIWHLLCTQEHVNILETFVKGMGGILTADAQVQSDEQRVERRALLVDDEAVFPTPKCPGCFWFDPNLESHCGRSGWHESFQKAAEATHEKARSDLASCPLEVANGT